MSPMQAAANYGVTWRFRNPSRLVVAFLLLALLYSLRNLKNAWPCISPPMSERSVEIRKEGEGHYESRAMATSADFLSPSTIHTIEIEGADGEVNCWKACSLSLQHTCSEPGRRECPAILRMPVKSTVAFEDLIEGDYIVTVNCEESGGSCYAEPQEFPFHVKHGTPKSGVPLRHLPLQNIKLVKKFTGQCSKEEVWRSRLTCLGILYTLMGVVLIIISYTERLEDEHRSPRPLQEDISWVLQSTSRVHFDKRLYRN